MKKDVGVPVAVDCQHWNSRMIGMRMVDWHESIDHHDDIAMTESTRLMPPPPMTVHQRQRLLDDTQIAMRKRLLDDDDGFQRDGAQRMQMIA